MKKQLLTAALMLTGMFALTPSVADAKSTMDSNLTLLWMNTDVAPLTLDVRQGFGRDGKFYLQNKATKTIEVWNETGRIQEIPSGAGTNITFDDAGNILVRIGTFPDPFNKDINELRIIPADGSAAIDIALAVSQEDVSTSGDMFKATYLIRKPAVSYTWVPPITPSW